MTAITDLHPKLLWQYFAQLCAIPRPTHDESAVQQFVLDEANRLGLWVERDTVGNILVRKPASPSYENAPKIILQSHLDMVAQKNEETQHDFHQDPIQAYIDDEWVRARGTTLGADNGIGAAAALAVLADNQLQHGAVEALFTASEEVGMDGAKGLQGGWLEGDILLNLDSEELGEICIGCAGGVDGNFTLPLVTEPNTLTQGLQLNIRGLRGGHSGIDIHRQRGNALKILVRLLRALGETIHISSIKGGNLRNAIPREAYAVFTSSTDIASLQAKLDTETAVIRRGLPEEDRSFTAQLSTTTMPAEIWTQNTQQTVLRTLNLCPNGVDRSSVTIQGLTETSTNLASVQCEGKTLTAHCLLRSLDDAARDDLAQRIADLFILSGGSADLSGAYPGWQPVHSPIIDLACQEGEKLLGHKPKVTVIHAGLECGLLGKHYPHWQMLSFGPTIEMPHSPDERVHIESVALFWQWLVSILTALRTYK